MIEAYPWISILPIICMLVLILITKRMIEPMCVGLFIALFLGMGTGAFKGFVDSILGMIVDDTYSWLVVILFGFGIFLRFIQKSGSVLKFGQLAASRVKSAKGSLMVTWLFGIIIFIDEYLNNLLIGVTMRSVTDKYNVPREMLAMTINGTGTSVTSLIPLNPFVVFVASTMMAAGVCVGENEILAYAHVIPYNIYAMVAVIILPLLIMGVLPKIGPLKKAYERAENGQVMPEDSQVNLSEEKEEEAQLIASNPKMVNFIVPILAVVAGTVITGFDMAYGIFTGIAACIILYLPQKIMTLEEMVEEAIEGIKDMVYVTVLICLAFSFVAAVEDIGFIDYMIEVTKPIMVGELLPAVVFLVVGALVFMGVDFWGALTLFMPIIVPLAEHFDVNVYLVIGALVSAVIFGSHSCFFTESMVMSSQSCQIKPNQQAVALFPYAVIGYVVSIIIYIILGFAM